MKNSLILELSLIKKTRDGKRNLIGHNIGGGQVLEDYLFKYKIIVRYTYI